MKKVTFCAVAMAIVLLVSMNANAQGKMSVGAGVDIMIPVGSFGDSWGTGFGGTAEFDYAVRPNFSFTGKIGYLTWSAKNPPTGWTATYSGVPLLVGVKWYPRFIPQEWVRFYGHLELGIMAGSVSTSGPGGRSAIFIGGSQTDFTIVPSVGIEIPAGPNGAVDVSARYFDISRKGSIGFRAGYKLTI